VPISPHLAALLILFAQAHPPPGWFPLVDRDGDGFVEWQDNCTGLYNPSQADADEDGFGNACDGDLNNSGLVTAADYPILRDCLNRRAESARRDPCAVADLNDDDLVTAADYAIWRAMLNKPPGPSSPHDYTPQCVPVCFP
jgi:hypothetical protein